MFSLSKWTPCVVFLGQVFVVRLFIGSRSGGLDRAVETFARQFPKLGGARLVITRKVVEQQFLQHVRQHMSLQTEALFLSRE